MLVRAMFAGATCIAATAMLFRIVWNAVNRLHHGAELKTIVRDASESRSFLGYCEKTSQTLAVVAMERAHVLELNRKLRRCSIQLAW